MNFHILIHTNIINKQACTITTWLMWILASQNPVILYATSTLKYNYCHDNYERLRVKKYIFIE